MSQKLLPQQTTINAGKRVSNQSLTDLNLLFFDPSQLKQSLKPSEIILGIEEQSVSQISNDKCKTSNFIMDFQTNIGINAAATKPPNRNCRMVNGIKSGTLSIAQRKQIKNMIFKIWSDILEEKKKPKQGCCDDRCDDYGYKNLSIFLFIAIIVLILIFVFDHDVADTTWWILSMIGVGFTFMVTLIAWFNQNNEKLAKTVKSSDPMCRIQVKFITCVVILVK